MRNRAIIDSGFLYATVDKRDVNHDRVVTVLTGLTDKILLPVPVIVETSYLIYARLGHSAMRRFVQQVKASPLEVVSIIPTDLSRIDELLVQYADLELDFVDAAITAIAERLEIQRILTVDQRDFRAIRPQHCSYFEILP